MRIASDGNVRVSPRNGTIFLKKTQKKGPDKLSLIFWGAVQSDGGKMLVRHPNNLNAANKLDILKQLRKNAFTGHYFATR